jgi:hypothetical protein
VAFREQMGGESAASCAHGSPLSCATCMAVLHDLNNVFATVLMNAQVMEGKLPSYSRSKRYIHEIERGVQRGGALVKRLLGRVAASCDSCAETSQCFLQTSGPPVSSSTVLVTSQEPPAGEERAVVVPCSSDAHAAPVFVAK